MTRKKITTVENHHLLHQNQVEIKGHWGKFFLSATILCDIKKLKRLRTISKRKELAQKEAFLQ